MHMQNVRCPVREVIHTDTVELPNVEVVGEGLAGTADRFTDHGVGIGKDAVTPGYESASCSTRVRIQ